MKEIAIKVYKFSELSEQAKNKARSWYRNIGLDNGWYKICYEDAAQIGLKITSFDLERNRHAKGEFNVIGGAEQCANLILKEHGKSCGTYKTAKQFLTELTKLNADCTAVDGDDETNVEWELWQDKRGMLNDEFLQSLLEDYSIILQEEYEYLMSDEQVDESIISNEYTFTESGKRFG